MDCVRQSPQACVERFRRFRQMESASFESDAASPRRLLGRYRLRRTLGLLALRATGTKASWSLQATSLRTLSSALFSLSSGLAALQRASRHLLTSLGVKDLPSKSPARYPRLPMPTPDPGRIRADSSIPSNSPKNAWHSIRDRSIFAPSTPLPIVDLACEMRRFDLRPRSSPSPKSPRIVDAMRWKVQNSARSDLGRAPSGHDCRSMLAE